MAHYAKIVNDHVVEVTVADSNFIKTLEGEWVQTSYNTSRNFHHDPETGAISKERALRGNYAGVGYFYDRENDVFYEPKPFDSWSLNKDIWKWEAPVPYPKENKVFKWDEEIKNWVEY